MKSNHSIPASTVIPVLIYPDVREAVAWLSAAFGFTERVRIGENHRAQLRFGDGALIVGDVRGDRRPPRPGEATHSVMVLVEDARAHCERARPGAPSVVVSTVTGVSEQSRELYRFELEPEVRDWLDSLSDSDFKRVDEVCGMLAEKGTGLGGPCVPDGVPQDAPA